MGEGGLEEKRKGGMENGGGRERGVYRKRKWGEEGEGRGGNGKEEGGGKVESLLPR